jgi:hypothetical protein
MAENKAKATNTKIEAGRTSTHPANEFQMQTPTDNAPTEQRGATSATPPSATPACTPIGEGKGTSSPPPQGTFKPVATPAPPPDKK